MAWVKVPPENHPIFHAALPKDPRVETLEMFGGVAAKVNGNMFAGVFGHSIMIWLPERERAAALALEGASPFDPMGDGRARSDKVMLPESLLRKPAELRRWLARSFKGAAALPPKIGKPARSTKTPAKKPAKAKAKQAVPSAATRPTAAKRSAKKARAKSR